MDELFILIIAAFWIFSGIVNAIQRKTGGGREKGTSPGEAADGRSPGPAEGPVRVRLPQGPAEGMTAEDFLKRIEALARGQRPTPDAEPPPHREERATPQPGLSPVPGTGRVPTPSPAPPSVEPRSDRWTTGEKGDAPPVLEGGSVEGTSAWTGADERTRRPERLPARVREPLREPRSHEVAARTPRQRPGLETRKAPVGALAPIDTHRLLPLSSMRGLTGLSRSELRRIFVLQEVLGPPLALRQEPPGSAAAGE